MVYNQYPGLDRLDLTESQLGSYKFTPVDNPPYQRTDQATVFSNDNLLESRLRLGPAAFRGAVDGGSPERRSPARLNKQKVVTSAREFQPKAFHPSGPSFATSRSEAYSPASVPSDVSVRNAGESVLKALDKEQRAHQTTVLLLEEEKAARAESEERSARLIDHNKSLLNSIRLLQSTIKHMVQKQDRSELLVHEPQSRGLETIKEEPDRENDKKPKTLLHDSLSVMRMANERKQNSSLTQSQFSNGRLTSPVKLSNPATTPVIKPTRGIQKFRPIQGTTDSVHLENLHTEKIKRVDDSASDTSSSEGSATPDPPPHRERHSSSLAKKVEDLFSPDIRWKIDRENIKQRLGNIAGYDSRSVFKRHPLRFLPDVAENNIYRTVMIDCIPVGTTYQDILDHVKGGGLESIQLCESIGKSVPYMTARIVYNYEMGARTLFVHGQSPGITIKGKRVRVWHVMEPTYPRNEELELQIFELGFTRLLIFKPKNPEMGRLLFEKLEVFHEMGCLIAVHDPTHITANDDFFLIEFSSIQDAARAFEHLLHDPDLRGAQLDFEPDFTEQAYS